MPSSNEAQETLFYKGKNTERELKPIHIALVAKKNLSGSDTVFYFLKCTILCIAGVNIAC